MVLLLHENRVCVFRRSEKMLNSLYVFCLVPLREEMTQEEAQAAADGSIPRSLLPGPSETVGFAKHIFTHQVWNMTIMRVECRQERWTRGREEAALWVDRNALLSLPMPSAMKCARESALQFLADDRQGV